MQLAQGEGAVEEIKAAFSSLVGYASGRQVVACFFSGDLIPVKPCPVSLVRRCNNH